jgi:hypothetical protein
MVKAKLFSDPIKRLLPDQRVEGMRTLTPANKTCPLEKEVFERWGSGGCNPIPLQKCLIPIVSDFRQARSGCRRYDSQ